MNHDTRRLVDAVLARHEPRSIEDVLRFVPTRMCHITQEPDVFRTYPPVVMRLSVPREQWAEHEATYARYRDEIIPSHSLDDYLRAFLEPDAPRLPCFCAEMSDVAGALVSTLLGRRVYAIRNIYVNYLYLPQRWHCINAIVADGRIRYFDSSAYRQLFDKSRRKFLAPDELDGFDCADVEPRFIVSDKWLQSEPFARSISLDGHVIRDTFHPNPLDASKPDEFLRIYE
ncbi:hypothetical protein [Burkholderia mayonis]|uniref:Uncharacterized protein n=1 Tax=Burkholderia mayonis TaxID=1385591 RepID=A0A1B4FZW3_9BURK|nr:hypothetical protein [Burkholderia mayonis]AOJ09208.1 hypothetical protein WS71_17710 [Burkholderia mayonis]KVE50024.1 hypothetical protein WS71_14935 [Burkholderia mayonis]